MPPRKRFGQHFLEPAWTAKVIDEIDPRPDDVFLEIGPGRGALTRPLASRAQHVVAVEIDRDLVRDLRDSKPANVTIVEGDFLTLSPDALQREFHPDGDRAIRVAGNLPYNVASPILFRLIEMFDAGFPLIDATVMLQREVADRLTARPGTKEYGVLTILVGHAASVERRLTLPAGAFRPAPKVNSAVVSLRFHARSPAVRDRRVFTALVQAIFTRRRKTLANALGAFRTTSAVSVANILSRIGLDGRRRPETLTVEELARLADTFVDAGMTQA
jgi:16S rRNA (adenine1518-N6/adenine1519-N6)-dimethyltransferase